MAVESSGLFSTGQELVEAFTAAARSVGLSLTLLDTSKGLGPSPESCHVGKDVASSQVKLPGTNGPSDAERMSDAKLLWALLLCSETPISDDITFEQGI